MEIDQEFLKFMEAMMRYNPDFYTADSGYWKIHFYTLEDLKNSTRNLKYSLDQNMIIPSVYQKYILIRYSYFNMFYSGWDLDHSFVDIDFLVSREMHKSFMIMKQREIRERNKEKK
jgi:hypothetical protein